MAGNNPTDDNNNNNPPTSPPLLLCRLDHVRPLADSLSCIYSSNHKAQDVQLHIPPTSGLRFTVEENLSLQACVTLRSEAFSHFQCTDTNLSIRLNLSLLIDCLTLFSGVWEKNQTSITILYQHYNHPLQITLKESNVVTKCELNTMESSRESLPDFEFLEYDIFNKAIVQSEALKEALAELDYGGAATAQLRLAPVVPRFRFQSPATNDDDIDDDGNGNENGDGDEIEGDPSIESEPLCAVELPDPSIRNSAVFLEFSSMKAQTSCYKLSLLQRCIKALSLSDTCRIRMNENGMLSLVCLMKTSSVGLGNDRALVNNRYFTEFLIAAEEIIEDNVGQ